MNSNNYYINNNIKFHYYFSETKNSTNYNVICKYYLNGYCKYGDECIYSHIKNYSEKEEESEKKEIKECLNYKIGFCEKGNQCPFLHKKEEISFEKIPLLSEKYLEEYFHKPINKIFQTFEQNNDVICNILRKINNLPLIEDQIDLSYNKDICFLEENKKKEIIDFMINDDKKIKKYFLLKCTSNEIGKFIKRKKIILNNEINSEIIKILNNENTIKKTIIIFILFDINKFQIKCVVRIKKKHKIYKIENNKYKFELLIYKPIVISDIILNEIENGNNDFLGEKFINFMIHFEEEEVKYDFLNNKRNLEI